jgi:1-acyl-sn-glycerol-3-phosphate acyltransferase
MMPEARLSTAGRFEDIQDNTYSFIKKSSVPVYTVKFNGDYFADPKWGKGFRRGAVVEAELDILYTAEDIDRLSVGEIKNGVEKRLYYNEFEWIKQRPDIKYRSKRMAEGLENILAICPVCHKKHTVTTHKNKVYCETCGYLTSIDSRYSFTGDFRFRNLLEWYDWQKEYFQKEISEDENFSLVSSVELRVPSNGKGLTRHAGQGVCILNRQGLTYSGSKDGNDIELHFPIERVYRLLFGAGQNFEIYNDSEILFFVPEEKRSNVDWYITSMLLYDENIGKA